MDKFDADSRVLAAITAVAFIHAGAATAQDTAAPARPNRVEILESIVVTARRREEPLQDTPIAVTALSAAALERQQILATTDLDKVAPNLQFHSYGTLTGNNSAAQVLIRGIGQTDATPADDPGVGIYIDELYAQEAAPHVVEAYTCGDP
jgi:iron complex outermembrane receptor protein